MAKNHKVSALKDRVQISETKDKDLQNDRVGIQKIYRKIKNHPVVFSLLVIITIIIGLATLTESVSKLWQIGNRGFYALFPQLQREASDVQKPSTSLVSPQSPLDPNQLEISKVDTTPTLELPKSFDKAEPPVRSSVKTLAASLEKISDDHYCLKTLLSGIPKIKGGVTGAEFAYILQRAHISSDHYCSNAIISSAKYIKAPIVEKDIRSILSSISNDHYHMLAAKALMDHIEK